MAWALTVRTGPRVERERFERAEDALAELQARASELADSAPNDPVRGRLKRYEPVEQVFARVELAGPQRFLPSVRVGVDIRGNGSLEAYRGRVKRTLIEQRKGESPYDALRRSVTESG